MKNLSQLIPSLVALTQKTSAKILEVYQQSHQYPIKTKADRSPVTPADLIASDMLKAGLQSLTPGVPVLSEEGAAIGWEERQDWNLYWLVDPLDGTQPFIQHTGEFCISVALIENHRPILGIIYVPITEECYYAHAAGGAYKIDAQGDTQPIHTRPWTREKTVILASHGANKERLQQRFACMGKYTVAQLSSAWKFCWLAEGKADISPRFGDTSEWDTAAAQCILEQAGGGIFDLAGEPLRYNTRDCLLNPHFIALADVERLYPLMPWEKIT
jgi:3'(2'), 5'-bisphosphate nucleotidase